jgi:hypothetical protein
LACQDRSPKAMKTTLRSLDYTGFKKVLNRFSLLSIHF